MFDMKKKEKQKVSVIFLPVGVSNSVFSVFSVRNSDPLSVFKKSSKSLPQRYSDGSYRSLGFSAFKVEYAIDGAYPTRNALHS